jgi:RNA polymerase sigma factor (sigma-70 family)
MSSETSTGLLLRVRDPADNTAWTSLVSIYTPLLTAWILRAGVPRQDADDLVQEVLLAVAREMPGFKYDRTRGSFRGWLRTVLVHRVLHRQRVRHAIPPAEPLADGVLDALTDPTSEMSRVWDEEHDRYVLARLLEAVRPEFGDGVWQAFARVVLDGERPAAVAADLGLSVDSVYQAKSRVLARLRQQADGLLD